jgi:hypothetical protein
MGKQTIFTLLVILASLAASAAQGSTRGYSIHLEKNGWGQASLNDIKAVLHSSCDSIYRHFGDLKEKEEIYVRRNKNGPIALFKRNLRGQVIIELNTGDRFWCQYAYQMAHEFCHVICRFRPGSQRNLWFEESLCELASIFSLRAMARDWKTNAPYPNWKSYSKAIHEYVGDLEKQHTMPDGMDLAQFYRKNADALSANPTNRPANGRVALALLTCFETNPEHWPAVAYLNSGEAKNDISFVNYLRNWNEQAPRKHSIFIHSIARKFGIDLYPDTSKALPDQKPQDFSKPVITAIGSGIEGSVTLASGNQFTGRLTFEPGAIRVSGSNGEPLPAEKPANTDVQSCASKDVKSVRFTSVEAVSDATAEKLSPSHNRKIWLKGGSLMVGKITGINSKSVTLHSGTGITVLPRPAVAIIDMRSGTAEGEWKLMLQKTPPGYLLANNTYIEAKLEEMTPAGEIATWSSIFGNQKIAPGKIQALKLANMEKVPPKEFVITTLSGSIILADSIISKGGRLVIRDNSRYFLSIQASEVLEIRHHDPS